MRLAVLNALASTGPKEAFTPSNIIEEWRQREAGERGDPQRKERSTSGAARRYHFAGKERLGNFRDASLQV
jgi:hypothetical protein